MTADVQAELAAGRAAREAATMPTASTSCLEYIHSAIPGSGVRPGPSSRWWTRLAGDSTIAPACNESSVAQPFIECEEITHSVLFENQKAHYSIQNAGTLRGVTRLEGST